MNWMGEDFHRVFIYLRKTTSFEVVKKSYQTKPNQTKPNEMWYERK